MDNMDLSGLVYSKTGIITANDIYEGYIPKIPEGYVFVSFGPTKKGVTYIDIFGDLSTAVVDYSSPRIIVRPLEINDVYTKGVHIPTDFTSDGFRQVKIGDWFLDSGGFIPLGAYSLNIGEYRLILVRDTFVPRKFTVETTGRHRAINKGEYYYFNGEVRRVTGYEPQDVFAEPCTITPVFTIQEIENGMAVNQYSQQNWQVQVAHSQQPRC